MRLKDANSDTTGDRVGPAEAYDWFAKTLHWGMAAALLGLGLLGYYMSGQPFSLRTFKLFDLHKSLGLIMLGLAALRLFRRWQKGAPEPLTQGTKTWELLLARIVHLALYVLMFAVPILGWIGASASGLPMTWFGLADIPSITPADKWVQDWAFLMHEWGVWLLLACVGLHAAGALKRHFMLKDETLVRMLPFGWALAARLRRKKRLPKY
ncbi:cytochrome b [Sinorhizobium meliloti]|uniref:Cytochrome b n=1 Tax=Rhizobium meliloti TaxID=382 RepID=A0A2J0YU30_RHIML|nr:cytochrome b [Sinorhizobium meliloti]PJR09906.1 cytochrome b [Sinorhizobium meliloti]